MWKRDAEAGYNLAWIEVKEEDECHAILGLIPKERMDKVVYLSPYENDVGFNVLHLRDLDSEEEAFLIVDTVVNAFSDHYSDSWGVQTEMCLALGKVYATTLASFVASNLQIATFRKKKDERKPTFFYYDEFQDYVNKSFEEALTQFRSYQTGVIMSHQYLTQLSKDVRSAIEGCVSSFIHLRAGNDECAQVVKRLQLEGQKKDEEKYVLEMPTLVCVTRLMHDGKLQPPRVVSIPFVRGINWDVSREIRNSMNGVKMKVKVGYHEQQRHEDIEQPVMVQENDHSADSGLELSRLEDRISDSPTLHEPNLGLSRHTTSNQRHVPTDNV